MKNFLTQIVKAAALLLLLATVTPSAATAQSLEKAVRLMIYTEPEIQAANYDRLSALEDWKITRGDLLPEISVEGSAGVVERDRSRDGLVTSTGDGLYSRQIGISLRQLLYDGGLARQETLSAKKGYRAQELIELSMMEARVVDLCEVYLEVLRTRELLREANAQINRYRDIRDMIKARLGKLGNRADVALADGRLSLAVNSMETQRLAYENALLRFVRLTGQPAVGLEYPELPMLPKELEGLSFEWNWEYQAALAVLEAAVHKYNSAVGNRGPKVYLDVGARTGQDLYGIEGEDNEARALVVLSWTLSNGGANKALQQREHWQVRKAEELVQAAREESIYKASLLWKEREGSRASVRTLSNYVKRLEGVLADYEEQFKVGRQELLNILDIHEEIFNARSKLINARYNVDTSAFRIAGIQGTLVTGLLSEDEIQAYMDRNPDHDDYPDEVKALIPVSNESAEEVRPVPEDRETRKTGFLRRMGRALGGQPKE